MPRSQLGHDGAFVPSGAGKRSPFLFLYLALLILGRRGVKVMRRDIKGLSRLSRHLQGQVAIRFWLLGPYYILAKRYFANQTRINKPAIAASKRGVQKALENYKAYSGIFALLGSASGATRPGSSFWPWSDSNANSTPRPKATGDGGDAYETEGGNRTPSPVPNLTLQCPTCVQRELEAALEREFANLSPADPVPIYHAEQALSSLDGNAQSDRTTIGHLRELDYSTEEASPVSAGFLELKAGDATGYQSSRHETRYVVNGSFDVTDATGQEIHAVAGDVLHFPKGSKVRLSTKEGGTAFYVLQPRQSPVSGGFGALLN